jgi:DNA-binding transcriptional LysR family regulator
VPGEYLLPQKLGAFTEKYPAIRPILRIGDSAGIVDDILDGKVELGVVGFKGGNTQLTFEKIWDDEMILVVPKDHPWSQRKSVQITDLKSEKFIARERGSGTLDSLRDLLAQSRKSPDEVLNISMQLGSTEAIKSALRAGFGISILSRISISHELAEGILVEVPIRGLTMQRGFYEVYHSLRPLHPIAQAFQAFLKGE